MQRRMFLKWSGASAAALGGASLLSACSREEEVEPVTTDQDNDMSQASEAAAPAPMEQAATPTGVQIYTLRDQLAAGIEQTLADIAAVGYREVELFGLGNDLSPEQPFFGMSAGDFGSLLSDNGLTAPISHINGDAMNIPAIAEAFQEIGGEHLIVAMAPEFLSFENGQFRLVEVTGKEQLDTIAARLNEQAEMARASGIGFGYHNHHMELVDIDGVNAFDYLFEQADADLVKIELDIGWVIVAGEDPVELLERYAGRVIAVHMKDFDPSRPAAEGPAGLQSQIVEPGSGPTDFGPIVAALDETGVPHRFVEIDLAPEPVAAITRGYNYLAGL